MEVQLNEQDCDDANLVLLSRMKHKTIYVLAYGDVSELAVVEDIVFRTDWTPNTEHRLRLKGLDLDEIWANIVRSIRNLDAEVPLHEAVTEEKRVRAFDSQKVNLEKKFRNEKQNHERRRLHAEIRRLKRERETKPESTVTEPAENRPRIRH